MTFFTSSFMPCIVFAILIVFAIFLEKKESEIHRRDIKINAKIVFSEREISLKEGINYYLTVDFNGKEYTVSSPKKYVKGQRITLWYDREKDDVSIRKSYVSYIILCIGFIAMSIFLLFYKKFF